MLLAELKQRENELHEYLTQQLPEGYEVSLTITPKRMTPEQAKLNEIASGGKVRDLVCQYFECTPEAMFDCTKKTHTSRVALAKFATSAMVRQYTKLSLIDTAIFTNVSDHTGVLYHIKKLNGFCQVEKDIRAQIIGLEEFIEANLTV